MMTDIENGDLKQKWAVNYMKSLSVMAAKKRKRGHFSARNKSAPAFEQRHLGNAPALQRLRHGI